jgi:hypothetical protein
MIGPARERRSKCVSGGSVPCSELIRGDRPLYGLEKNAASNTLRTRQLILSQTNLIQLHHNIYDGDEISLHPNWAWNVRHEVNKS